MTSPEAPSGVPRSYDEMRKVYEKAYRDGSVLQQASVELDQGLARIMPFFEQDRTGGHNHRLAMPVKNEALANRLMRAHFKKALDVLRAAEDTSVDRGGWQDYYRLMGQVFTLQIRHQAQLGMMLFDEFGMRRKMVDGLSGIHVGIAEHALLQLDTINEQHRPHRQDDPAILEQLDIECGELMGVISEHTVLALLNYDQSPNRFGVIPMLHEDLHRRTDIMYYYHDDSKDHSYKLPIQVKTSRKYGEQTPENGITLVVTDYMPQRKDRIEGEHYDATYLARLLVKQHRPETLEPKELQHLALALNQLKADIAIAQKTTPGTQLPRLKPVEADPTGSGPRKIWQEIIRKLVEIAA